jgi:hypothetical protein
MTNEQDRKPNQKNKQAEKANGDQTKGQSDSTNPGVWRLTWGPPAEQVKGGSLS